MVGWHLIPEQTLERNLRPDGVLRDSNNLRRGLWEAKGPKGNLEQEIGKKINDGYPLTNTIFENTLKAVLYQNKKRTAEYDLQNADDLSDLLRQFFTYTEPDIATFEEAVQEFTKIRTVDYVDLPTGHWPQFSRPEQLAEAIVRAALRPAS